MSVPVTSAPVAADESPFRTRHLVWLALATLLAAALRLWHLGEWSFWVDEAHSWRDATMPLGGELGWLSTDRALYPITFVLLRTLLNLGVLGADEASLRLPFAVIGILSVPLLAWCGRRMVGPRAAVAAAWLCALHPWHVFWSQNARGYALVFLASIWVANRTWRWLETGLRRHLVLALSALALGVLSHPTGVFLASGVALFLVLRPFAHNEGERLRTAAPIALLAMVVLAIVLARYSPFSEFLEAKGQPDAVHVVQTVAYYFRPALLLAGCAGLVLCGLRLPTEKGLLVSCLLLMPLVVLLVVGGLVCKATARYAYCTLPLWLLLAGRVCVPWLQGLRSTGTVRLLPAWLAAAIVAIDLGQEVLAYHGPQHGQRARWRQACAFAQELAQADVGSGPRTGRLTVLTINQPSVSFYLEPRQWSVAGEDAYPDVHVQPMLHWLWRDSGGREFLRWHADYALRQDAAFAVLVTLPELLEVDDGQVWATLNSEFELALHLPCWVGPKDESIYVFVPRLQR